jgi:CO/xanthine dehydrogenase Mo-binding subunit
MSVPKVIGERLSIRDAALKVTGELKYTGDMRRPGMLTAKMLLSPHAHAKIKSIDVSEAQNLPGVFAVACHTNTTNQLYNSSHRFYEHQIPDTETIFSETVRFVGDRVAAVAAVDAKTAEAALRLIKVEYEMLPAVFDPETALEENATAIHPGGNQVGEIFSEAGDVDAAFEQADHVFEHRYEMPPIHHIALETHASMAEYDAMGRLTVWSSMQNTFAFRIILSRLFNLPMNRVRMILPAIGGAFGSKLEVVLEAVVAQLAIMTRRPVKLVLNRRETMISTRTRHAAVGYIKTGVMKDGTILAQDIRMYTNTGAYASSAMNVAGAMSHKVYKVYQTPNMRVKIIPTYTNLPIAGAMRGYGSPQIFNVQQVQMAVIARELGIDLVELQLKNAVAPDGVDQRFKQPIGNPRLQDIIRRGAEMFDWPEKKKEIPVEPGWKRGIGMAIGAHGNGVYGAHRDVTTLSLKINEDGTLVLYTGAHDMGNGSVSLQAQMVASVLDVPVEDVGCIEADTDLVPWNLGDYASRGVFIEGACAKKVAESMKAKIAEKAATFFEVEPDKIEFENRSVFVVDQPDKRMSLGELVVKVQGTTMEEIIATETYPSKGGPTSYGVHFAEVLVNAEKGIVKVVDYAAVHDVGQVINRAGIEGQLEGGIQMGIGYALTETMLFNDKGKLMNSNLKKYRSPKASDMPKMKIDFVEAGEPLGPYGAKSIGECTTVPSAPAVFNAVCNAIGKDLTSFPVNLEE